MDSPDQMPCTNCGEKMATHFITCIDAGVKESQTLCDSCFEEAGPAAVKSFMEAMKNASCRYCGGRGMMGAGALDVMSGGNGNGFMCSACSGEYHRFLQERFKALAGAEDKPSSEQMSLIHAMDEEVKAHMKRWVIQRYN